MMQQRPKTSCPHCGPAPVPHFLEYLQVLLTCFFVWLFWPIERLKRKLSRLWLWLEVRRLIPLLFWLMKKIGVGKIVIELSPDDNLRTRAMWEEATRRGIKIERLLVLNKPTEIFLARFGGKIHPFEGLPRPRQIESEAIIWMDDKLIMKKKFMAAGFPVARGASCSSLNEAIQIFNKLRSTVIVKPRLGSRSRHTFTHITDLEQLTFAFRLAKQISPWIIVEEELVGPVFRATIIGGQLIGVIRRDQPQVVGNGKNTVRELVAEENKNILRAGPIFCPIPFDEEAGLELIRQRLTWESIPPAGEIVFLGQKVSRGCGATTTDVTAVTHPDNKKLFEAIGNFLADPLVGIDFIIKDISHSWKDEAKSGVIECNSLPYIDLHHYPYRGTAKNAAGALWDLIYPDSKI